MLLPHALGWSLVFFRLTGLFLIAPIFSNTAIPTMVKALFAFILSLCVYPALLSHPGGVAMSPLITGNMPAMALPMAVLLELAIGAVIGFAASLPMVGMQVAGLMNDQQIGTGLAGIYNPEIGEDQVGVMTQFYYMAGVLLFLVVGGHRLLLRALLDSFTYVPLAGFHFDGRMVEFLVGLLTASIEVALRLSAPLLCLVFLETVAMGFVARTVPQMNILSIGFPLRVVIGVGVLIFSLSADLNTHIAHLHDNLVEVTRFIDSG